MPEIESQTVTVYGDEDQRSHRVDNSEVIDVFLDWMDQVDIPDVPAVLKNETIDVQKLSLVNTNDAVREMKVRGKTVTAFLRKNPDLSLTMPLPENQELDYVSTNEYSFIYRTNEGLLIRIEAVVPEIEIDGLPTLALVDAEFEPDTSEYQAALTRLKDFITDELRELQSSA